MLTICSVNFDQVGSVSKDIVTRNGGDENACSPIVYFKHPLVGLASCGKILEMSGTKTAKQKQ